MNDAISFERYSDGSACIVTVDEGIILIEASVPFSVEKESE